MQVRIPPNAYIGKEKSISVFAFRFNCTKLLRFFLIGTQISLFCINGPVCGVLCHIYMGWFFIEGAFLLVLRHIYMGWFFIEGAFLLVFGESVVIKLTKPPFF